MWILIVFVLEIARQGFVVNFINTKYLFIFFTASGICHAYFAVLQKEKSQAIK